MNDLISTLKFLAEEQRSCAAQCIHAYKAKASYIDQAEKIESALAQIEHLVGLKAKASDLNVIVEGVRNSRWAADGVRLKDTREWCAFYTALKATEAKS